MVKSILSLRYKLFSAILFGLIIAAIGGTTAHAEGSNQFPGVTGGATDWTVNRTSPDPNLTWLYKANPPNETLNGLTTHILRNRHIGRNTGTRLRVYFAEQPTQVSITVRVVACELDAPHKYAGALTVVLGGVQRYREGTQAPHKIDHFSRYRVWPTGGGNNRIDDTSQGGEINDSSRFAQSPVCDNYSAYNVPIWVHRENCAPAQQKANGGCNNNGNETYSVDQSGNGNYSIPATNTKLDNRTFTVNFVNGYDPDGDGRPEMGFDQKTNLYFADLDIDLDARNDPALIPAGDSDVMQRITFNVVANNVTSIDGSTLAPKMGYRFFDDETQAERYFGLEGNGGRNNTYDGYGQKLAVPFGPSCNANGPQAGKIILYDADVAGFGDVYMMVFKRNPSNGNVVRLDRNDYQLSYASGYSPNANWRVSYDNANDRILSTANSNENSIFYVKAMEPGFQYMLAIVNPHQASKADPSGNVYSLRLPTDSMNGLVNCRFDLIPLLDSVQPIFSDDTILTPHGSVEKLDVNTTAGTRSWRITRAVFNSRPTDLSRVTYMNSGDNVSPCEFVEDRSGAPSSCASIYTGTYPTQQQRTEPDPVGGPHPFGTYICYITSVKDPTWRPSDNDQWRHSAMQCSARAKQPKLQTHGGDLRVASLIACGSPGEKGYIRTSFSQIGGTYFGSWGEFGAFSRCNNYNFTTGAHLANGRANVASLTGYHSLTFANSGVASIPPYGRYSSTNSLVQGIAPLGGCPDQTTKHTSFADFRNNANESSLTGSHCISSPGGEVVIDTDVILNANPGDIEHIPQLVVVARDIKIRASVSRVDAWLIAQKDGAGNGGGLYTCVNSSDVRYTSVSPSVPTPGLSTTRCDNQLVINGPMRTNKLYADRTHGANDSADEDEAGEVFNLPASSVLWWYQQQSQNGSRIDTVSIRELPPRY